MLGAGGEQPAQCELEAFRGHFRAFTRVGYDLNGLV